MIWWTPRSAADLADIYRYIARYRPSVARAWVLRLQKRAIDTADAPLAGRVVPEHNHPDIREVLFKAYRIVYRVHNEGVEVLTVFEGHRLLGELDLEN